METLEDLLPGIENYLNNVLAKEKLSRAAEKKRKYFVERLDVLKLPPSLPPRPPDGLSKTRGPHDFIAQQRALARENADSTKVNGDHCDFDIGDEYDDVDIDAGVDSNPVGDVNANCQDEELYEVPLPQDGEEAGHQHPYTDDDSGTSYESFDEDEALAIYQNEDYEKSASRDDVPLPSVKVKKKKKRKESGMSIRDLPKVTYQGELYQKGLLMGTKRHCVISDHRLLCFKSERDTKPLVNIVLVGYDILFMDRDGKYSNVLRISHPGCETHWFYAENKDSADAWLKHLNTAASVQSLTDNKDNVSQNSSNLSDKSPNQSAHSLSLSGSPLVTRHTSSTTNLSSVSSSEGGSGDGVVQPREPPPPPPTQGSPSVTESDRRKASGKKFSISDLLGTFSKKKGQQLTTSAIRRTLDPDVELDPSATISGFLNICTEPADGKKWTSYWCVVKEGSLSCYSDPGADHTEHSLILGGLHIGMAPKELKRELGLRLIQGGQDKLLLEPSDSIEQGRWLNVLIKETGYIGQGGTVEYNYIDEDGDDIGMIDDVYDEVNDRQGRTGKGYDDDGYVVSSPLGSTIDQSDYEDTDIAADCQPANESCDPSDAYHDPGDSYDPTVICDPGGDSYDPAGDTYDPAGDSYDPAGDPKIVGQRRDHCDEIPPDDVYEICDRDGFYIPCDLNTQSTANYVNCDFNKNRHGLFIDDGDTADNNHGDNTMVDNNDVGDPFDNPTDGTDCDVGAVGPGPPPLPKTAPPVHRLSTRRSKSDVAGMFPISKRQDSRVEDEVDQTFSMIKAKLDSVGQASPERRRRTGGLVSFKETDGHPDVVKCHSGAPDLCKQKYPSRYSPSSRLGGRTKGPAISEDQEILLSTRNPILSELRKSRQSSSCDPTEAERLQVELSDLRRKAEFLKKRRAETRAKKLLALTDQEKRKFERELQSIDKEMERTETDRTKKQVLLVESEAQGMARSDSLRSNSSNRSNTSSPRSSSLADSKKSSSFSSDRMGTFLSNSSPDSKRKDFSASSVVSIPGGFCKTEFSTRTATTKLSNGKAATLATTSTLVTTKRVAPQSRSATLSSKTEPVTNVTKVQSKRGATKDAISKWNAGIVTTSESTTATQSPARNVNVRSSTKTVSSASQSARKDTARDSTESTTNDGQRVQAKLQLWEKMVDSSSNC